MQIVLVEWDDPCSSSPMWEPRDDIKLLTSTHCICVGILLYETERDINLCLSFNSRNYTQAMAIPRKSIKRIRKLKIERGSND